MSPLDDTDKLNRAEVAYAGAAYAVERVTDLVVANPGISGEGVRELLQAERQAAREAVERVWEADAAEHSSD